MAAWPRAAIGELDIGSLAEVAGWGVGGDGRWVVEITLSTRAGIVKRLRSGGMTTGRLASCAEQAIDVSFGIPGRGS